MSKPCTLQPQPAYASYWKHLRPEGKREFWKAERKSIKQRPFEGWDNLAYWGR